ncbi:MAG: YfaZ family outer membrane protein [Thiohalomonadales bacterium]
MIYRWLFISFLLIFSLAGHAQDFTINLGDTSVQVNYATNIGGTDYGRSELRFGYLRNSDYDTDMLEVGLLVIDNAGSKAPGLEVGLGPKLYIARTDCCDASAIGLGGVLRYSFGSNSRFFILGQFYYAPGVVSFADSEGMYEGIVEIGFEVLPTADIYLGMRDISVDFGGPSNATIDDSGYFGMKFSF